MKVTVLKRDGKKEVINRVEVGIVAAAIEDGRIVNSVRRVREVYHLMSVNRQPDGQITTNWVGGIRLPRICFAADYRMLKGEWKMMAYNGLVVLEVNDLSTYEKAVEIREMAKRMPETMLCFLGGSGRSVKIVCRGELLAQRYANFDPETSFRKIGNALNDVQFNFKSKRTMKHMEYWLIEK